MDSGVGNRNAQFATFKYEIRDGYINEAGEYEVGEYNDEWEIVLGEKKRLDDGKIVETSQEDIEEIEKNRLRHYTVSFQLNCKYTNANYKEKK